MNAQRVAVIGSGGQGSLIATGIAETGAHVVVAVCDPDADRARALGDLVGAAHHGNHRDLLNEHEVDVVVVASMPADHRDACLDALAAGAHVLCEKPMALDANEAEKMGQAAARAGRRLSVNFNMRFLDQAQTLRAAVERGDLGAPVSARAWCRGPEIPWWGPHYQRVRSGGGVVASSAVHLLDLALWLSDYPTVLEVSASTRTLYPGRRGRSAPAEARPDLYDVEDHVQAFLRADGGFSLCLDGSWTSSTTSIDYGLEITLERGDLFLVPATVTADTGSGYEVRTRSTEDQLDLRTAVRRSVADFLDRITHHEPPAIPLEHVLAVQRLTDAIYESSRTAAPISLTSDA